MEAIMERTNNVTVVTIPGDSLDAANAKEFKRSVSDTLARSSKVVFDLSHLQFVDSSGLGAILSCFRQLSATGGDLKLCGMTKSVRVLFELVRMHRVFDIYNSKGEAVRAFEEQF